MATAPKLTVRFFRTQLDNEPGMPLVRKLDVDLWEVRVRLKDRTARVLFTIEASEAILLHGFIKKSQKIPDEELATAVRRRKQLMSAAKQLTSAAKRN